MDHFDTIVVGAGVSGLTCARLLARAGRKVVVLEARDRVGGRVVTDRRHGLVTDLGASWIHGINDSPVAAAAEAFGMRTAEFTVGGYQPDSRPIAYYGPDGERLTDADAQRFIDDIHAVDATLLEVVADSDPDASYRDVTDEAIAAQGWERGSRGARARVHASTGPRSSTARGSMISPPTASTTMWSTATRWSFPMGTTGFRRTSRWVSTSDSSMSFPAWSGRRPGSP